MQHRFEVFDFRPLITAAVGQVQSKRAREQTKHGIGLLEHLLEHFVVHIVALVLIVFGIFARLSFGRHVDRLKMGGNATECRCRTA